MFEKIYKISTETRLNSTLNKFKKNKGLQISKFKNDINEMRIKNEKQIFKHVKPSTNGSFL